MEKPTVSRTNLSSVIVIMTIMCIAMAMSGGDGIDSGTRVPITRCMWIPVATSCPLPEDPAPVALSDTGKTHGHDCRGLSAHQAGLSGRATSSGLVMKSCSSVVTKVRERTSTDFTRV
jgi:hypothetical protein